MRRERQDAREGDVGGTRDGTSAKMRRTGQSRRLYREGALDPVRSPGERQEPSSRWIAVDLPGHAAERQTMTAGKHHPVV